jgi:hypothetical protein
MKKIVVALAATCLMVRAAWAEDARPIVVELYTSQSCGPCVPADNLLAKIARKPDVVALTLNVNYWDVLGWKDTLANEAATNRQKMYSAHLGRGGVYTPQMIIDGQTDVVGNREDTVVAAIEDARRKLKFCVEGKDKKGQAASACFVPLSLTRSGDGALNIAAPAVPGKKFDASVWLFAVRRSVTVHVGGGENKGRVLNYANVARDLKTVGKWTGAALSLRVPAEDFKVLPQEDVFVILQQDRCGRILGATVLAASDHLAKGR